MREPINDQGQMPLTEHLRELRFRMVRCLQILLAATVLCWSQAEHVFNWIRKPIEPYLVNGGLIYTSPLEKFMAFIKISVVCGMIISCPFWIYQIWKFVAPGLYQKERKYTLGFVLAGSGMFVLGNAFSYFVVLPMAFKFLMTFGGEQDKPMIAIDSYLSFFTHTSLVFGLAFELPVIISTLGLAGIVSQNFLKTNRRYAVMAIAVVCAIITPPDLLSMILMLVPMVLLYEISVFLVGLFERKRMEEELKV